MTREDCLKIIRDEDLQNYNLDEHAHKPDEVVVRYMESKWVVYVTSERAGVIESTCDYYDNEFDAYDDFIARLRADKELRALKMG